MHLATDYALHNQAVNISGPFLGLTQACTTQKARRAKLANTNLLQAEESLSFCCSLKEIWNDN